MIIVWELVGFAVRFDVFHLCGLLAAVYSFFVPIPLEGTVIKTMNCQAIFWEFFVYDPLNHDQILVLLK